jgi:hypothetical protein
MTTQNESPQPLFIKRLIANIECANCGTRYELGNIYIIGRREDLWISAVVCTQCGTQGLIFAMVKDDQVTTVPVDVSHEETLRFKEMAPLGIDDVIDMHRFLSEYDGDFLSLLPQGEMQG